MKHERFADLLKNLMRDAGLNRRELQIAVEQEYGPRIKVTNQDLSTYLAGDSLPRLTKLAAIADVCGATHSQIALLVRSVVHRNNV